MRQNNGMSEPHGQTPFAEIGGLDTVRRIVDRFYQLLQDDPRYRAVRALHGSDMSQPKQALTEFMTGWLGGPPLYFQRPGHRCVMSAHAGMPIGAAEVEQWLAGMAQAMGECGVDKRLQRRILDALTGMAKGMRNRT